MASFLRSTFDNIVKNINETLNQHTNQSSRAGRSQNQESSGQIRNRDTIGRPNTGANANLTGQRACGFSRNFPCCHASRHQQSNQNQRRTTRHQPTHPQNHNSSPYNTRYSCSGATHSQAHINSQTDMNSSRQTPNNAADLADKQLDIKDVHDPQDINQLTAKQLKIILTRNCIDYKGIFEKEVLREKVMQLWIDCNEKRTASRRSQVGSNDASDDIDEASACKICMEREINCVLLECGHMLTCVTCGRKLAECPICRQNITRCVRTFRG